MEDYIQIQKALKNIFSGMSSDEIESLMRVIIIGAIGGLIFLVYLAGKIIKGIRDSINAFIDGYKGKK